MFSRIEYKTLKARLKKFIKYILKVDWRSFYGRMQEIQEMERKSSKIGKKDVLRLRLKVLKDIFKMFSRYEYKTLKAR